MYGNTSFAETIMVTPISLPWLHEKAHYLCKHHWNTVYLPYLVASANAYQVLNGIDIMRKLCCRARYLEKTTMTYKVEADVPLTLHIIIPIFISAGWSRSRSRSRFDPGVSILSLSSSLKFTWAGYIWYSRWFNDLYTTHSSYWISNPASAYTPIVLIYFSVQDVFSVFPSHLQSTFPSVYVSYISASYFITNFYLIFYSFEFSEVVFDATSLHIVCLWLFGVEWTRVHFTGGTII